MADFKQLLFRKYYHLMGEFVKWVRPTAQLKYGFITASPIMLFMIRIENFLYPFYGAKRPNHDPPLIYGSCFTYSLYSQTTGR